MIESTGNYSDSLALARRWLDRTEPVLPAGLEGKDVSLEADVGRVLAALLEEGRLSPDTAPGTCG